MVSLKDIAQACHVSIPTVSQILNGKAQNYASEETKHRILATARQMGYHRNYAYRLMRGQPTQSVALLVSLEHMLEEEHIQQLVTLLLAELDHRNYVCSISPCTLDTEQNLDKIRELIARGAAYFIILGSPCGNAEIEELLTTQQISYVATSELFQRFVHINVEQGAAEIIRYLYRRGGENFRVLNLPQDWTPPSIRHEALQQAFPHLNFAEITQRYVRYAPPPAQLPTDYSDVMCQLGRLGTRKILHEEPQIQALFCTNDLLALGAATEIAASGRQIGRDIVLGGFNNNTAIRNHQFPISSVSHDWIRYYKILVDALFDPQECHQQLTARVLIRE